MKICRDDKKRGKGKKKRRSRPCQGYSKKSSVSFERWSFFVAKFRPFTLVNVETHALSRDHRPARVIELTLKYPPRFLLQSFSILIEFPFISSLVPSMEKLIWNNPKKLAQFNVNIREKLGNKISRCALTGKKVERFNLIWSFETSHVSSVFTRIDLSVRNLSTFRVIKGRSPHLFPSRPT